MKKIFLLVAGLTLLSTGAMASKARLKSLSQGENGSYYLMDARNVFFNPATMMTAGDYANFEAGATALQSGSTNTAANAEGGFIQTMGSMKYGIQLGKETQTSDNIATVNGTLKTMGTFGGAPATADGFLAPQNAFELQVGGDAGVKWGASLLYASSDSKTDRRKSNLYAARVGAITDMWGAYLNFGLGSNAEGVNDTAGAITDDQSWTYKGTTGFRLGGHYNLGEGKKVYYNYDFDGATINSGTTDLDSVTAGTQTELQLKGGNMTVGYADVMGLTDKSTFFYSLEYYTETIEASGSVQAVRSAALRSTMGNTSSAGDNSKNVITRLPITLGFEAEAASWLTLRASIKQSVLMSANKNAETDSHASNETTVAAGAGLKFNKLTLDGTLAGMSGGTATGDLNMTSLLAYSSLTYNF